MTLVIAHRGASAYAPENTLPAFELAVRQGADMLELDVQRSADGVLVVFHDDTTERWDGRKRMAERNCRRRGSSSTPAYTAAWFSATRRSRVVTRLRLSIEAAPARTTCSRSRRGSGVACACALA